MGVKAGAEHPQQSAGPMLLLVNKIGFVCFYDSSAVCVRQTHTGNKNDGGGTGKKQKCNLFTINTSSKQINQDNQVYEHTYNAFKIVFYTPVQCSPVFIVLLPVHLSLESSQLDKSVPNNMHWSLWKHH